MNRIKKILFLIVLSFHINLVQIQASAKKSHRDDHASVNDIHSISSNDTSIESDDNDFALELYPYVPLLKGQIAFFIEKPNADGTTNYFDRPQVIQAFVMKSLSFLKDKRNLGILDPQIRGDNAVSQDDFIQCNGPVRAISDDEYYNEVYLRLYS